MSARTGAEIIQGADGNFYMIAELDEETHIRVSGFARVLGLTVEQALSLIVNDTLRTMAAEDPEFRVVDLTEYRARGRA